MLLKRTAIGKSQIQGIGLFASEHIKKGEPLWMFLPGFDLLISENQLKSFSPSCQSQILNYAYLSTQGNYVLCGDDARFINHSHVPNTLDDDSQEGQKVAARDINPGEEITSDYRVFDLTFDERFKHGIII